MMTGLTHLAICFVRIEPFVRRTYPVRLTARLNSASHLIQVRKSWMNKSYTIFLVLTRRRLYDRMLIMKKDIHPTYYNDAKILCSCGNVVQCGSTKTGMTTEICSACHPFYTGKKKMMDTAGKVERFKARGERTRNMQDKKKARTAKVKKKKESAAVHGAAPKVKKILNNLNLSKV